MRFVSGLTQTSPQPFLSLLVGHTLSLSAFAWEVWELLLGAWSFRTVEFQVTTFHTHENLYSETSSDINATIASEPWYRMIWPCLIHRVITFGAEFDVDILIFAAQTRHV